MPLADRFLSKDPSEIILITSSSGHHDPHHQQPSSMEAAAEQQQPHHQDDQESGVDTHDQRVGDVEEEEVDHRHEFTRRQASVSPTPVRKGKYRLSDLNIQKPKKKVVSTFFGTARTISSITWLEWVYIVVSIVSIMGSGIITIVRMVEIRQLYSNGTMINGTNTSSHDHRVDDTLADYTFAILLLWTAAFSLYHVLLGVISERAYDLVVYMFSTVIIWGYVLINFIQGTDVNSTDGKLVRLALVSCVAPVILTIGVILCKRYITSNSLIFYTVGANEELQSMFGTLLIHDSLLKFDVQMGGSVLILWVQKSFIEPQADMVEVVVIVVGVLITIFWVAQAYLAIRLENIYLVYSFYASSWLEPAMVIFNMIRTGMIQSQPDRHYSMSLIISAYACGIIALISRGLSVYTMHRVSKNFGRGLKAKIFKYSMPEAQGNGTVTSNQ